MVQCKTSLDDKRPARMNPDRPFLIVRFYAKTAEQSSFRINEEIPAADLNILKICFSVLAGVDKKDGLPRLQMYRMLIGTGEK